MKQCQLTLYFLCFSLITASSLFARPGFEEPWGKDATFHKLTPSSVPELPPTMSIFTKIAEQVILFHQNVLSETDGPRSAFRPTSSRYMLLAMRRHGFIKGYLMGCDRLLRENKDEWVYRKQVIDGIEYKWDPTYKKLKLHAELSQEPPYQLSLDEIADASF